VATANAGYKFVSWTYEGQVVTQSAGVGGAGDVFAGESGEGRVGGEGGGVEVLFFDGVVRYGGRNGRCDEARRSLGRRTSGPLVPTDVGGGLGFLGFAQGVPGELVGFGGVEFGVDCWAEIGEEAGAGLVEDEGEGLLVFGAAGGEVLEVGG
jgi:hypothetical protein